MIKRSKGVASFGVITSFMAVIVLPAPAFSYPVESPETIKYFNASPQTIIVGSDIESTMPIRDTFGVTDPPPPPPPVPVVDYNVPTVTADPGSAQAIAAEQVAAHGWDSNEFNCLVALWNKESGWRVNAMNSSSGAYGIPQSLPGEKMASAGDDWQTNPATQIAWGLSYIQGRYGTPCGAWQHSVDVGWY